MINTLIWCGTFLLLTGLFTNGFGLFDKTYKGTWVKVNFNALPTVMANLKEAKAFMDSDGMGTDLEVRVHYVNDRLMYEVKIPKFVFHRVEFEVVLKELGVR